MATITISKKEYSELVNRQERIEKELGVVKRILEDDESNIRPSALKKWERISRDLDRGKGRSFTSMKAMKKWLHSFNKHGKETR